jgi:hypothetical protein
MYRCVECGALADTAEKLLCHRLAYHSPRLPDKKEPDCNQTEEFKQVDGKICTTLVPSSIMWAIGRIRTHFTKVVKKYPDPQSWRKAPMQHYIEAADRHWLAAREDPHAVNEESGMPHLWHCATNLAFIIEMIGVDVP